METFSALLVICVGNSPVTGEFPTQKPVMRSFDVIFDLRVTKRLSKQSSGWWFETPSRSLWRHCNVHNPNLSSTLIDVWSHGLQEWRYMKLWVAVDPYYNTIAITT